MGTVMKKKPAETTSPEEWIQRWNLDEVHPPTACLMRRLAVRCAETEGAGFLGQIQSHGIEIDAVPSVFYKASVDADAEGRRTVIWVVGFAYRRDCAFGKMNEKDHPELLPGPVIQIHAVFKDYTQGHIVPPGFKTKFKNRATGKTAPSLVMSHVITKTWPRPRPPELGTSWMSWGNERELFIIARGFPNLEEEVMKVVDVLDESAEAVK